MNRRMFGKKITAAVTVAVLAMNTTVFAAEDEKNLTIELGGNIINIQQLAEDNGVDPYELKEAIESGINAEKASPFSNLATDVPNSMASENVEYGFEKTAESVSTTSTKVNKLNQDSTAYVANSGALTASGKTPYVGMCAMHTNVTTKTGSTTSSIVKLGTRLYMANSVNVNGMNYAHLVVDDRGEPTNRTAYWIDVYFGLNNQTNYNAAINYGLKTVSYSYYY